MEKVKKFVEDFVEVEAKMLNLKYGTDILAYNTYLPEYYAYFVKNLNYGMGHMDRDAEQEAQMDEILEMTGKGKIDRSNSPLRRPRHFFKLSEYTSDAYGKFWVAYVSGENPSVDFKDLTVAFFVIEEDEKLAIAKEYSYTDFETNGVEYRWEGGKGLTELTFDSLKDPVKIERYLEPNDMYDGLVHYHADI